MWEENERLRSPAVERARKRESSRTPLPADGASDAAQIPLAQFLHMISEADLAICKVCA
jgi:hypothetical protein